jgi:hypothetical protein
MRKRPHLRQVWPRCLRQRFGFLTCGQGRVDQPGAVDERKDGGGVARGSRDCAQSAAGPPCNVLRRRSVKPSPRPLAHTHPASGFRPAPPPSMRIAMMHPTTTRPRASSVAQNRMPPPSGASALMWRWLGSRPSTLIVALEWCLQMKYSCREPCPARRRSGSSRCLACEGVSRVTAARELRRWARFVRHFSRGV